jgi:hypothetical protein
LTSKIKFKETLYNLSVDEIKLLCSTDINNALHICNDDTFWKNYVITKYNIKDSWKNLAKLIEKDISIIDVNSGNVEGSIVGNITINYNMYIEELLSKAHEFLPEEELIIQITEPISRSRKQYHFRYDGVNVKLYDSVNVKLYDSVNVKLYDSVNVKLYDSMNDLWEIYNRITIGQMGIYDVINLIRNEYNEDVKFRNY